MKHLTAAVTAFALIATQALAAGPLAPGKPAGVTKAQDFDQNMLLYVLGGAAVIAGIAILASNDNNKTVTGNNGGGTTTTTTT